MCYKRVTDKKFLEAPFYNEEICNKYPDGSPRQISQQVGEMLVGTIDFDRDGNEMDFNSRDERTKWISGQIIEDKKREWEMLDPDYKPKNADEIIEIMIYRAQDMRLHTQVEELEKIRCNFLQSSMTWDETNIKWEDVNWTWGGGTAQDKKIQDEAMKMIEEWEKESYIDIQGSISETMNKRREEILIMRNYLNLNVPPEGSPEIPDPKWDFKGKKTLFAFQQAQRYEKNKDNPSYKKWATNRLKYFRWLQFSWTINGDDFTAEQLVSLMTTQDYKGWLKDEARAKKQDES